MYFAQYASMIDNTVLSLKNTCSPYLCKMARVKMRILNFGRGENQNKHTIIEENEKGSNSQRQSIKKKEKEREF